MPHGPASGSSAATTQTPVGYWPRTRRYQSGSMARMPVPIPVAVIVITSCGSTAILSALHLCVNVEVDCDIRRIPARAGSQSTLGLTTDFARMHSECGCGDRPAAGWPDAVETETELEFGLLYEWQMPVGVSRSDESRHFLQMMEQIKLAEEVGFTSVWSVEHHFLESFSHASAPEVLLSWIAAADLDDQDRPRSAAAALPLQPPDPRGRAGRDAWTCSRRGGWSSAPAARPPRTELGGFGIDPAETREMWRESLELILKAWTGADRRAPRQVLRPGAAADGAQAAADAPPAAVDVVHQPRIARGGRARSASGCSRSPWRWPSTRSPPGSPKYRERIKTAEPIGEFVNNQTAVFTMAHCAPTTRAGS